MGGEERENGSERRADGTTRSALSRVWRLAREEGVLTTGGQRSTGENGNQVSLGTARHMARCIYDRAIAPWRGSGAQMQSGFNMLEADVKVLVGGGSDLVLSMPARGPGGINRPCLSWPSHPPTWVEG